MSTQQIPVIDISAAEPRVRGQQYGEAAAERIVRAVEFYRESFVRTAGLQWPEVCERATAWVPHIEAFLPQIVPEMRGIAEGAGLGFEEILALNARGELSSQNPFAASSHEAGVADLDGCSSYALMPEASGDGHVYCGQNWDWRSGIADTTVVTRIAQPGKPTLIMQVEAGQVGRQGANSAGLALNANGLGGFLGSQLGVPGTVVRRRVLESWDMHDALETVFAAKQAFSTNILLTHREGVSIDIETTPGRHGWLYPDGGILVHGNHFMSFVPPQIEDHYKPFSVDSLYRVPRIRDGLTRCRQAGDSEGTRKIIGETMRDHFGFPNSVCNHADERKDPRDRTETIVSSIVDLTSGEYYITDGLPCESPYRALPWNLYDGPGPDEALHSLRSASTDATA